MFVIKNYNYYYNHKDCRRRYSLLVSGEKTSLDICRAAVSHFILFYRSLFSSSKSAFLVDPSAMGIIRCNSARLFLRATFLPPRFLGRFPCCRLGGASGSTLRRYSSIVRGFGPLFFSSSIGVGTYGTMLFSSAFAVSGLYSSSSSANFIKLLNKDWNSSVDVNSVIRIDLDSRCKF